MDSFGWYLVVGIITGVYCWWRGMNWKALLAAVAVWPVFWIVQAFESLSRR